ncbi:MAG TPA: Maf family protein [Fimbriimonadaceae bacterium]|nr:Maf family protein [Fimbriimonadaceae bacterium]
MIRLRYPVVLASASPRRQELLRRFVPEFEVVPAHLDEDALTCEDPAQTACRLAREKALAVFESHPDSLVIAGDTVVALPQPDGSFVQLSKPIDASDAIRMLSILSGRSHWVITGLALRWPAGFSCEAEQTQVFFRKLDPAEVEAYVETGEPMDKAGGYGIQAGASPFIDRIEGSWSNVVGLPLERLEEALKGVR